MLRELSLLLDIDEDELTSEFREIHQLYENTEQPFAITELPIVKKLYPDLAQKDIVKLLDVPLHAFNKKRKETLVLYDGVESTLEDLRNRGVRIIGHTESTVHNALFRLEKLGIRKYFEHLYTLEGKFKPHPNAEKNIPLPDDGFVIIVPKQDRKPNPRLVKDICAMEGVQAQEVAYVGDSLTKDISMAREAGVTAIWAKYGREYASESWNQLVKITHWSDEDVERETQLREKYHSIKPDFEINSFSELLQII